MPLYITRNLNFFNVKDSGALGDGTTDDTTAITLANTAAAVTGGVLFFPPGTYITTTQTLKPNVIYQGAGVGATTIKLKNGTNADLFSAQTNLINLSATYGTGIAGTLYDFALCDLALDGNKANQTSGTSYPLRFYGYAFSLKNIHMRNGFSGGILCDWNGGAGTGNSLVNMESQWMNVEVHDTNGIGIQTGGPHDSQMLNVISYNNKYHAFHFAPNAGGFQVINSHGYGCTVGQGGVSYLIEGGYSLFVNAACEGGDVGQVAVLGNGIQLIGARVFALAGSTVWGVKIGQAAGETPLQGQIYQSAGVTTAQAVQINRIDAGIEYCEGTHGAIWLDNDGGKNNIKAHVHNANGSAITGNTHVSSQYKVSSELTADGTIAKGGIEQVAINCNNALAISDTSNILYNFNTNAKRMEIANGSALRLYSDNFSTDTFDITSGGDIFGQKIISAYQALWTSTQSLASSGTISHGNYYGFVRVTPTGNVTGIIVQAAQRDGQVLTIVNDSAFSVTMATAATSNVADGTSAVIPANRQMNLTWYASTSRWFHT